jgi:hypothetical protein
MSDCFDHYFDAVDQMLMHGDPYFDDLRGRNSGHVREVFYSEHEDVVLKRETEKAWLFKDGGWEFWVPKSVGLYNKEGRSLRLPTWFNVEMKRSSGSFLRAK